MKVILLKNDHIRIYSFHVTVPSFLLFSLLLFVVIAGLGAGSVYKWLNPNHDNVLTHEGVRNWQDMLGDQQQNLVSVRQQAERYMDALTLRLAELQGRITRLDALGERLLVKANIDDGEFDFASAPAIGGAIEAQELSSYAKPELIETIDELALLVDNRERQLDLLDSLLTNRALYNDSFVAGRPVEKGWLSSKFGHRIDPFTGKLAWHEGVDFAGKLGADIMSMAAGVVTYAGRRSGYGLMVEVNHANGYVTRYAHNDSLVVKVGDVVKRGQTLSKMGSSGRSTGVHVHIEILKNGRKKDPAMYISRASDPEP